MARLAILADIHGNLPALEAVLQDIALAAPDRVVVDGDVVNRGPQSGECLALVRSTGWPVIFGNHEDYVLKFRGGSVPAEWASDWWLPTRCAAESLSAEEVATLRALPRSLVVQVPGLPAVHVAHGSPRALNDGLGFWMSDSELTAVLNLIDEPVLVGAHTHRPFERRLGDRWVLNCGAVGAPFNGDAGAQYLLLTAKNGAWQPEFRSVPYDRAAVYAAWQRSGHLERSMAARVFKLEVETATFHLMSYCRFCETHGLATNAPDSFDAYRFSIRDIVPGRSLKPLPGH